MSESAQCIVENLARVRERMANAARRVGRPEDRVRLVAVTKYVGAAEARALLDAGCHDLGESRPQELWRKAESIHDPRVRWHQIGHLQRNKARRTATMMSMLHSGDSVSLLEALDGLLREMGQRLPVLLEVNVSGEAAKHGFSDSEMAPLMERLGPLEHLEIRGLMAMATFGQGLDVARQDFARLRELRDRLKTNCPPNIGLDELSMGTSEDFEAAIEEGATIVRVGAALFEGLTHG